MDISIKGGGLSGVLGSVPSKSDTHRALICAALADAPTQIRFPARNGDIEATIACLSSLGAEITDCGDAFLVIPIKKSTIENAELNCSESGSTLRFLLPVAAALGYKSTFLGRGSLPVRPIGGLKESLEQNGAVFSRKSLPLSVSGTLRSGTYQIAGDVSSQYISGLLMALPLLSGDSRIDLTSPLCSEPYVLMTIEMLSRFGITAAREGKGFMVPGGQRFKSPGTVFIDGDWSAAAFFLAAGAVGGNVTVTGLRADSAQGDKVVAEILKGFGAEVDRFSDRVCARYKPLKALEFDVSAIPDLFPILAVVASCAEGRSVLYNAKHLRYKESDRLKAVSAMISSLGGKASEYPDRLEIVGTQLTGGTVDSFGDHRIVMSAAIAASVCVGQTVICGAEATGKSYPKFFGDFTKLGGTVAVRERRIQL
ncbi:MAG: 3-phosphoshikimate 1-carboxyvinyltransferase [Oscillospiraceae bacterium]|nr:3-phosphoshikimate 1-carboxyvinyltransferase [Oscillospiraceae bacterium]